MPFRPRILWQLTPTPQGPQRTKTPQEPFPGFGAARTPLGVVTADKLIGIEDVFVDDDRTLDGDPFGPVSGDLTVAATGSGQHGFHGRVAQNVSGLSVALWPDVRCRDLLVRVAASGPRPGRPYIR